MITLLKLFDSLPEDFAEFFYSGAGYGGDCVHFGVQFLSEFFDCFSVRVEIGFVGDYDLLFLRQDIAVLFKFATDGFVIFRRVGAVGRHDVEDVDDQCCSLDVLEEIVTEACAYMGAFDQAGDVGHNEPAKIAQLDDA